MEDLIIIDDFLDDSQLQAALRQLEEQGLSAFENFQLPGLVNHQTGRRAQVVVPGDLVRAAKQALGISPQEDSWVTLPALMSRGDVRSHRDVWQAQPATTVHSYTVILWIRPGGSQLILEAPEQRHLVDALPGRFVAFNNGCFQHEVRGTEAVRAMLGPMALNASGTFQAVMDAPSTEWNNRSCCSKCMCCCFLCCCALPCLALCQGIGEGVFTLLLVLRAVLGTLRGAVAAAIVAPVFALLYAVTALIWSPLIFIRACKGLGGEQWSMCLMTLLLLPLRAPLVLLLSLFVIFLATFLWIFYATLVFDEDGEECKNLLFGGLVTVGPFTGVLDVVPKLVLDWWRYHARWNPNLELFPTPQRSVVQPDQIVGADLEGQRGIAASHGSSVFLDGSETWQYLAGSVSTKDVWEISLRRTTALGVELHSQGYITDEDIQSLEPFLFVGLPAAAVVRLVLRSLEVEGLDFEEIKVTAENRPHNAFADSIWSLAMKAKREAQEVGSISDAEKLYLTVTALQRPVSNATWDIQEPRQVELSKIVAAAVDLSLTASRSRDFKVSIGAVIQGILETPPSDPKEGWS